MWFRSGGGVNKFWRVIFSPKQDNHTDVYISLFQILPPNLWQIGFVAKKSSLIDSSFLIWNPICNKSFYKLFVKFSLVWWKKWQKIGIWWNWVSVGRFWNFGFSQFHRDWLNHRGAGAWKGCSSGSFSNSFLKILCRKKRRILKRKENEKGCISNSYLYNLRNVPLQPSWKEKVRLYRVRRLCTTNSFPPMLEKSDHSESDRKLIQAHWTAGGILVVIHPNPKHYNSCMAWGETTWGGGIQRGIWMKKLTSEKQEIISSFPFVKTHVSWLNP